jgi:hypothetical protein
MERIGVRELRQNAGWCPSPQTPWDELSASGAVRVPDEEGDITDLPPGDFGVDATAVLGAMREDER